MTCVAEPSAKLGLRLRPPRLDEEAAFRAAQATMDAEGWPFAFDVGPDTRWSDFLRRLDRQRCGLDLPDGWVPTTYLIADVGGQIVGRTSIRHELNEFLAREGGHIGYAVLPEHRRRGHATEILRQSLTVARAVGIDRVLITCDDTNTGSIKVIEACGGRLESLIEPATGGIPKRRYWID